MLCGLRPQHVCAFVGGIRPLFTCALLNGLYPQNDGQNPLSVSPPCIACSYLYLGSFALSITSQHGLRLRSVRPLRAVHSVGRGVESPKRPGSVNNSRVP